VSGGVGTSDGRSSERLVRVLETIAAQPAGPLASRLCAGAAQRLDCPGVGIAIAALDDLLQSAVATDAGLVGERLQEVLGEGPCLDAHQDGVPVLAPDLADERRWPVFGPSAVGEGILAAFSFPLRSGVIRLGTLNLYRPAVGGLDDDQHEDALVFCGLAVAVLTSPSDWLATDTPPGSSSLGLLWPAPGSPTAQFHQATGMVAAQLEPTMADVTMADAVAVLRAHAFTSGRTLDEVASQVLDGSLRFDDRGAVT
jgi:GAF domain-containing protein